jgi:D-glycero-D-manno-heptose 1,7-bisphosphate phosphatase
MSDKAIFLDRDGTLIEDPGYINNPDQVKLLDYVPEALMELKATGYKLIVVSNQSAVARGIVTEKVLAKVHERLEQLLAEKGAFLDRIYYCPYHAEGAIPKYRKESNWRKPNPGMLLAAAEEMGIDLGQSWAIGNSPRDIEAGLRAGCKTILINRPSGHDQPQVGQPTADYKAVNLKEAVNIIKKYHRSRRQPDTAVQPTSTAETQPLVQITEQPARPQPGPPQSGPQEPEAAGESTEQLLRRILEQLKSMHRAEMFGQFSMMRLLAGVLQVIVLLCLMISIWFLMSPPPKPYNSVFISLGFAMVFQVMSLTFYIMQGRK